MLYSGDAYRRGMWPRVNAYYSRTYDGFDMPLHEHDNTEVMYVFSGECEVYAMPGDEPVLTARMRSGDFIFLNAHVRHRLSVRQGTQCTMLNVEFTLEPAQGMFTLAGLRGESADYAWFVALGADCCRGDDTRGELLRAMDALVSGLGNGAEQPAAGRAEMALFLMRLSRAVMESRRRPGSTEYVRRAAAFIQRGFAGELSVADVAAQVGVSADHLGRLFRAETGQTVARYIEGVRVDHAAVLLERSRLTVSDIAEQAGFGNRQRFDAAFKRRYGMPPGEYRIKRRSGRYPQVEGDRGGYGHTEFPDG